MNRALKVMGWTLLVGVLLSVALVAVIAAAVGSLDPAPVIEINGDSISLMSMGAGDWIMLAVAVMSALFIVLFVVPVVVLVPLLVVALVLVGVVGGVVLVSAGAMALVCSPLILLIGAVWLIVRLVRGGARGKRTAAPTDATIAG